jgi:hypothetical protein
MTSSGGISKIDRGLTMTILLRTFKNAGVSMGAECLLKQSRSNHLPSAWLACRSSIVLIHLSQIYESAPVRQDDEQNQHSPVLRKPMDMMEPAQTATTFKKHGQWPGTISNMKETV